MSLAVIGEDCQKEDRVGVEVQCLTVIMAEDGKEELRPATMALTKSG